MLPVTFTLRTSRDHHYMIDYTLAGPQRIDTHADRYLHRAMRATNRRLAIRIARERFGRVTLVTFGKRMSWDFPTAYASGDVIADYRHL